MDLKMFKKIKPKHTEYHSIIDGIIIAGDITGDSGQSILINGHVIGSVRCEKGDNSTIIIGEKGNVTKINNTDEDIIANLSADHIVIRGKVLVSNVCAYQTLTIEETGELFAHTIKYGILTVSEGGKIVGYLKDDKE